MRHARNCSEKDDELWHLECNSISVRMMPKKGWNGNMATIRGRRRGIAPDDPRGSANVNEVGGKGLT